MTIDAELPLSLPLDETQPPIETAPAPAPAEMAATPPRFGAVKALVSFFILFAAQIAAGVFVVIVAMISAAVRGIDLSGLGIVDRLVREAMPAMLFGSGVFSTAAVLVVARLWAWPLVFDRTDAGLGITRAKPRAIALWAVAGAIAAALYCAVPAFFVAPDPSAPAGPLAQAAAAGGMNRVMWVLLALLFAPLVEEFFFRGLLLKGFATSWGLWPGAIVTSVLFVSMHLFETWNYWPATVAIVVMATLALVARITTRSLVPAIALHGAYNLTIALASWAMLSK